MSDFLRNYLTVAIFGAFAAVLVGAVMGLGALIRPVRRSEQKSMTYESGVDPVGDMWSQSNVRYYVFALLFVLFDVEAVFIFPWAVQVDDLGWYGLVEMTVFVAVVVQALPFLVIGVLLSAAIAVFVPASFFVRALPKRPALAVPAAGAAGVVLPGCECASVPVAGALVRRGVTPAAALAFLLSAPAINPIVLTATAVAFPGNPFSSKSHYAVFMRGETPLTSRLLRPTLIEAETGRLTDTRELPLYAKVLLVSQPLHFGDYGGMPLKILWALLDLITIVVLSSGLYLWWKKGDALEEAGFVQDSRVLSSEGKL